MSETAGEFKFIGDDEQTSKPFFIPDDNDQNLLHNGSDPKPIGYERNLGYYGADAVNVQGFQGQNQSNSSQLNHYNMQNDFIQNMQTMPVQAMQLPGMQQMMTNYQFHLPQWACRYCCYAEPTAVVRCIECNFWFCNSSNGTSASHIIHHLVRSKHKHISLHPQSHLGETVVECYNCSNRNVFMMGFIPAKGESVVVLLCRNCLHIGALKELGWTMEAWTPLVQNRELVSWLVSVPEPYMIPNFGTAIPKLTTLMANKLEDLWKINPNATLNDLERPGFADDEPEHVQLRYEDGYHYQRIFEPLVKLEADYDREVKESLSEDAVSLRWKISEVNRRVTAVFVFSAAMSESLRITIGDELRLKLSKMQTGRSKDWESSGTVVSIEDDAEISLELRSGNSNTVPLNITEGYNVSFVWKPITFDRMQTALKTFAVDDKSLSGYLYHKILGHQVEDQTLLVKFPDDYNVAGLPKLNSSQIEAIRQVLRKPLALIQGPPGTGKTVTCASLVYHLVEQNGPKDQVLVTAPSNVAVDQLCAKIEKTGVRVVRIAAKSREHLESDVEHLALHNIVTEIDSPQSKKLKLLLEKKERAENQLSPADLKELIVLRKKIEKNVLKNAQVICCTCSGAGDPRIADLKFKQVLLDEATQATEPESLIPIVMGCKHFVLVGDHCQLGPVVMCKKAATAGLNHSLFERLVSLGLRPIRLQVQYRMHPALSEFPSNTFYEGSLQNGVNNKDREMKNVEFPWPNPEKPMMFYSCMGSEEIAGTGTSYLNRTEASNCEKVVTALLKAGVRPDQIGVVTPYEGQRAYIVMHMQRSGPLKLALYKQIEVSSVDAFQGREKDFIILSCVRSSEKQGIGFLNDPRRLNVALTRAKFGCIVLGNPRVLAKRALWNTLLVHYQEQGLLVEGPLTALRLCNINFVKRKFRDQRQQRFENHAAPVFSGDRDDPYGEKKASLNLAPVTDSRFDKRYGGAKHSIASLHHQNEEFTAIKSATVNGNAKIIDHENDFNGFNLGLQGPMVETGGGADRSGMTLDFARTQIEANGLKEDLSLNFSSLNLGDSMKTQLSMANGMNLMQSQFKTQQGENENFFTQQSTGTQLRTQNFGPLSQDLKTQPNDE